MSRQHILPTLLAVAILAMGVVPSASGMELVRLNDGDRFPLTAGELPRRLLETEHPGYGYNESIPGPILRVRRGATVHVPFTNNLPEPTTVHWHGLRHDIRNDGVPGISQEQVEPGETFIYQLHFRDAGVFWYHPHVREDRQQDMGLYGVIIVEDDLNGAEELREEVLIINDTLLQRRQVAPFGRDDAVTHALMGRFGNVVTVNGSSRVSYQARVGETLRLHLLNVASARPYNIVVDGARMKLVGTDLGPVSRQRMINGVLIAPAERYTVDLQFAQAGEYTILDRTPAGERVLGSVRVEGPADSLRTADTFDQLREHNVIDQAIIRQARGRHPDAVLEFDVDMGMMNHGGMNHGGMHGGGTGGGHMGHGAPHMGRSEGRSTFDGIEWYDDMPMMNAMSTSRNTRWFFREPNQNQENGNIRLSAEPGSHVLIRLVNRDDSPHPMHHPIHLHGQRFVVLSEDGRENDNFAWKDTVLVRAGSTVDILVEVQEPGRWMLHCHIPEHMEAGMMTFLTVEG